MRDSLVVNREGELEDEDELLHYPDQEEEDEDDGVLRDTRLHRCCFSIGCPCPWTPGNWVRVVFVLLLALGGECVKKRIHGRAGERWGMEMEMERGGTQTLTQFFKEDQAFVRIPSCCVLGVC